MEDPAAANQEAGGRGRGDRRQNYTCNPKLDMEGDPPSEIVALTGQTWVNKVGSSRTLKISPSDEM